MTRTDVLVRCATLAGRQYVENTERPSPIPPALSDVSHMILLLNLLPFFVTFRWGSLVHLQNSSDGMRGTCLHNPLLPIFHFSLCVETFHSYNEKPLSYSNQIISVYSWISSIKLQSSRLNELKPFFLCKPARSSINVRLICVVQ